MNPKNKLALGAISVLVIGGIIISCTQNSAKAKPNFVTKPAEKPGVLAKINGEEITEEALIGSERAEFFEIRKREYELRMMRLNELLVEKIIGKDAADAKMSQDDFIKKNITKGEIKISDKEYQSFVAEKKIPKEQITPDLKGRIEEYLMRQKKQDAIQAYLAKATKKNPIEVFFAKPRMNVQVDVGSAPVMGGKESAPVTIVEFSDFQCPYCKNAAETVNQIKKKYGNKVRVAFKHFPLPMHQQAKPASMASMCVHEQSADKFWKYHDLLFKGQGAQGAFDDANLEKYAKEVGANVEKFKECYGAKKYEKFVDDDLAYGEKLGVRSTPTFFINGELVSGALPMEQFVETIDEAIEESKK